MSVHPQAEQTAEIVKYEYDMLVAGEKAIVALKSSGRFDQLTQNFLLESLLIHARNLRAFFLVDPQRDDVSAIHYFDNAGDWQQHRAGLCQYLEAQRERLNRALAHISFSRINYKQQKNEQWDIGAVVQDVKHAWDVFLGALPTNRKAWFTGSP